MINDNINYMNGATLGSFAVTSSWTAPSVTLLIGECVGQNAGNITSPNNQSDPNMFTDVFAPNPTDGRGAMGLPRGETFNTGWQYSVDGRHNNGSNVLYLDGHVKWLRPDIIADGNIMPVKSNCNEDGSPTVSGCYTGSVIAAGTAGTWQDGSIPAATVSPL